MKTLSKITFLVFTLAALPSCNEEKNDAKTESELQQEALEEKIIATNEVLFAAWNTGDAQAMEANLAADFNRTQNGVPGAQSREEYIELMKFFRTAMPDMSFTYELVAVNDNKTLTKWTAKGTNTGMFGDQPPTGKSSVTHGFTILTYNDEAKAVAEEAYFDQLSYLQEWGYTLNPPATE